MGYFVLCSDTVSVDGRGGEEMEVGGDIEYFDESAVKVNRRTQHLLFDDGRQSMTDKPHWRRLPRVRAPAMPHLTVETADWTLGPRDGGGSWRCDRSEEFGDGLSGCRMAVGTGHLEISSTASTRPWVVTSHLAYVLRADRIHAQHHGVRAASFGHFPTPSLS
ncbi:hypothetical protein CCMA1212_003079 [Trichoderma ghanense]|uniref:Uncharacterized protein n=1 Tax=Trichoderma ghanense TaxID=65468 RepID=A0ABY2HAZ5_9HYPO